MPHSNAAQRFAFPETGQQIRTVLIDGAPWFVGRDIAEALELGNPPRERSTTYVTPKGEGLIWRRLYAAGVVGSSRMPARQLMLDAG